MKKLLALVLALVMTLGLATVGTNAAFTDKDAVAASDYSEAIEVLNGMGVFNGYPDGSFKPANNISRAEVAAMIYRLYTGDVKDTNTKIYTSDKFSDVKANDWYAGYVGFCENSEFIFGDAGKFRPNDPVTGYQALAMVLRAVGYNKEKDFTGGDWKTWTANYAQQRGLVTNVSSTTLDAPASRALVAEILFEAAQIATATHTPALGYTTHTNLLANVGFNDSLGWKNFKLAKDTDEEDSWGRPSSKWYKETDTNEWNANGTKAAHTYVSTVDGKVYATISDKPVYTTTKPVTECDLAEALGIDGPARSKAFDIRVNGKANTVTAAPNTAGKYFSGSATINPLATSVLAGNQGQILEIYEDDAAASGYRAVVIDTYLAKVTDVRARTFDTAGHLQTPAKITMTVWYDGGDANTGSDTAVMYSSTADYTYAKGDFILVNLIDNGTGAAPKTTASGYTIYNFTDVYVSGKLGDVAQTITGTQSLKQYLPAKKVTQRTIDGTAQYEAVRYYKDAAVQDGTKAYTWFLDTEGNLIGSALIETVYSYGVINDLWWNGNFATGVGTARANVTYMDGTTGTITLSSIAFDENAAGTATNGVNVQHPFGYASTALTTMAIADDQPATPLTIDLESANNHAADTYGIIAGKLVTAATANNTIGTATAGVHLFRFETLTNGTVAAAEVNGEILSATVTKGNPWITGTQSTNRTVTDVLVNSDTMFLVRTGAGTAISPFVYKAYTGYNSADAVSFLAANARVDYVLSENAAYAKYVFVYGATAAAGNTYGFVYNTGLTYTGTINENAQVVAYQYSYVDTDTTTKTINVVPANRDAVIVDCFEKYGTNVLYQVTYNAAGYVTAAEPVLQVDGNTALTAGTQKTIAGYGAAAAGKLAAKFLGRDAYVNGETIHDPYNNTTAQNVAANLTQLANVNAPAQNYFNNVSGAVVYGGTLADITDPAHGYDVTVIYDAGTYNGTRTVKYIYINKNGNNDPVDMNAADTAIAAASDAAIALIVNGGGTAAQKTAALTALQAQLNNVSELADKITPAEAALVAARKTAVTAALATVAAGAASTVTFAVANPGVAAGDLSKIGFYTSDGAAKATLTNAEVQALLTAAGATGISKAAGANAWNYTYDTVAYTNKDVAGLQVWPVTINGTKVWTDAADKVYADTTGTQMDDAGVAALLAAATKYGTGVVVASTKAGATTTAYKTYAQANTMALVSGLAADAENVNTVITSGYSLVTVTNAAINTDALDNLGGDNSSAAITGLTTLDDDSKVFAVATGFTVTVTPDTFGAHSTKLGIGTAITGADTVTKVLNNGDTSAALTVKGNITVDVAALTISATESVYNIKVVKHDPGTLNGITVAATRNIAYGADNAEITITAVLSGTASAATDVALKATGTTVDGFSWTDAGATGVTVNNESLEIADGATVNATYTGHCLVNAAGVTDGTVEVQIVVENH